MPYFTPYIDASGYHYPTYRDIVYELVANAQTIYGQDIYLGIDSQDYQYISAFAKKVYDTYQTAALVYNNRSPATAIGNGLDAIVKINGIRRNTATYSNCYVTLHGNAGTQIYNGVVQDINGINWSLPDYVAISPDGTITVLAACQTIGEISVNPGEINRVVTPTYGWSSVTNAAATNTVGQPVEADSELRSRQSISTARPSKTVLEGLKGQIAAVSGVTRFQVYENDTNVVNSLGLPPKSITCVVENGADQYIADAIYLRKAPGCYTNGDVIVNKTDIYGQVTPIRFYRPSYVDIDVTINVKALNGYTSQTTADIKGKITDFLNSLDIGDSVSVSSLWGIALSAMPSLVNPLFSITALTAGAHGGAQGTADIPIAFNKVSRGKSEYITVNVV